MKKCPECGRMFKNLGVHMRAHKGDNDAMREKKKIPDEKEAAKPQRPIERFRARAVTDGGGMLSTRR